MSTRSWSDGRTDAISHADLIQALYQGILGREADENGLNNYVLALRQGISVTEVIRAFIASPEFKSRQNILPDFGAELPDLTALYPDRYMRLPDKSTVFTAASDEDFNLMESLIARHRYYDSFGVWSSEIDLDKKLTAGIVEGLGARSCVEFGCFNGPVLSLLEQRGLDVCGVELSHLACLLAYPNVHDKIRFGALVELAFQRPFGLFLAMDIFEHLNPLNLDRHVARAAELVAADGFCFVNSPMFGADDVFGTVSAAYLPEWRAAGAAMYWRHLHCDEKGWPMHGHLVWASPAWWEALFARHDLVRDRAIERAIHKEVDPHYARTAPARRSFFVLRHAKFSPDRETIARGLASNLGPLTRG